MKKVILFFTVITLLSVNNLFAESETNLQKESTMSNMSGMSTKKSSKDVHAMLKVQGNCETCKKRIEKAASGVAGVSSAVWDQKTKELHLNYSSEKTSVAAISKAIAKVGYDTEKDKADKKIYDALPSCCKYR